jgi:hypothetical protein
MHEEMAVLFMDLSAYSIGLPAVVGVIKFKKLNRDQRMLFWLVSFSFVFELAALLVGLVMELNNLMLLHIFTVIQFFIITLIFRKHLKPIIAPTSIDVLIVLFFISAIINALFLDGLLRFNTYARALESGILVFFALAFYYKTLKELKIKHLEQEPMFWISTAIIIYFSGSLIIFIVSNYFITSDEFLFSAWGMHAILNVLANTLYAITLWIKPQT